MTFTRKITRTIEASLARSEPTVLVSIVASHRRDHSCAGEPCCPEEEALIETLVDAAKSSEDVTRLLASAPVAEPPPPVAAPTRDVPVFPGLSTLADFEASDATAHRAAVSTDLIRHCAGALYYHEKGKGAPPWSLALYDERETFLNRARVVLGAEDHFRRGRRS